jgi:hypothetical protein
MSEWDDFVLRKHREVLLGKYHLLLHEANKPRDAEIVALREQGQTYRAIADQYDLSPERVAQICKRPP